MFSILVLTVCLKGEPCKDPHHMSGPITADNCAGMEERANANLRRNGYVLSRAKCQPYKREQVAVK